MSLFKRLKETTDPETRGEILLELAHRFSDEYDSSSDSFTETFHKVMDDYHQAYLAYNQAGLRLGRVLVQVMDHHVSTDDAIEVTMPVVKPTASVN